MAYDKRPMLLQWDGYPVRVAHISDCYLPRTGGIELQVRGLTQAERAFGLDPFVVTATPKSKAVIVEPGEMDNGVPIHRLAIRLPAELPVTPHINGRLREVLATADVVHVHGGLLSPFAWPALRTAVTAGLPAVVSVHSVWAGWSRAFAMADLLWHWRRWPILWTGVSELAADGIRSAVNGQAQVRVLHNGIDLQRWAPKPSAAIRDASEVVFVSVARLAMRKRAMALVDMLATARERVDANIKMRAVLIGDGPDRGRLEHAIAKRNLDWIELTGWQNHDQIREHYANSDVYISPSRLESFGIAALEARTSGLPIVALKDSGVTEFIHDGVEGLLAKDDAGMVRAISRLSEDSDLRQSISTHNRTVAPPFDWPVIVEQAVQCYTDAIAIAGSNS